jgi:hypothetical protein
MAVMLEAQGNENCAKKLRDKAQGKRSRNAFEGSLNSGLENENVKFEPGFSCLRELICESGEETSYPKSYVESNRINDAN